MRRASRGPSEWRPEDGLTTLGYPQCCARRAAEEGDGPRCRRRVRTKGDGAPVSRYCGSHAHLDGDRLGESRMVNGRYRPFLGPWLDRFQELLDAEDILQPEPGLALLDAETERHLQRAEEGDTPAFRRAALNAYDEARSVTGDPQRFALAWRRLGDLLQGGVESDSERSRALKLVEKRLRLSETARRTSILEDERLTANRVAAAFAQVIWILRQHLDVADAERVVDAITREVLDGRARGHRPLLGRGSDLA